MFLEPTTLTTGRTARGSQSLVPATSSSQRHPFQSPPPRLGTQESLFESPSPAHARASYPALLSSGEHRRNGQGRIRQIFAEMTDPGVAEWVTSMLDGEGLSEPEFWQTHEQCICSRYFSKAGFVRHCMVGCASLEEYIHRLEGEPSRRH